MPLRRLFEHRRSDHPGGGGLRRRSFTYERAKSPQQAAAAAALTAVGLDDVPDTNPYDLGYSRRKLLALASVLAMGTPREISSNAQVQQAYFGRSKVAVKEESVHA